METNKLLTLEEIERFDKFLTGEDPIRPSVASIKSMLATARAYWEMMDKLKKNIPMLRQWLNEDRKASPLVHSHDIAQWLEVPMEFKGYMSIADEQKIIDAVKPEDKPHPATLKVIVEALEAGREFAGSIDNDVVVFNSLEVIKSLEKHLE